MDPIERALKRGQHGHAKKKRDAHREAVEQSAAQAGARAELLADIPRALEQLIRVKHIDRVGAVVPLAMRPGQVKLWDTIERTRALQMSRQLNREPGLAAETEGALSIRWAATHRERIEQMRALGVERVRRSSARLVDGPVRLVIGKCRRGGFSSLIEAVAILRCNLVDNFEAMVMAHKGENAELVFGYVRDFQRRWPDEWQHLTHELPSSARGQHAWANGSRMRTITAGSEGSSRGDQADLYHFSECAYYPTYDEVNGALSGMPEHAWLFEESTANGTAGGYYERFQAALPLEGTLDRPGLIDVLDREDTGALEGWNQYVSFFFSWLEDPRNSRPLEAWERDILAGSLDERERQLVERHGATLEQVAWRRERISQFSAQESGLAPTQLFDQEFPTTADDMFQSSGSKFFMRRAADQINEQRAAAHQAPPPRFLWVGPCGSSPHEDVKWRANLRVREPPVEGARYIGSADIGKGLASGDYSVVDIWRRVSPVAIRQVAQWRSREFEGDDLGDILVILALAYNEAELIWEANDAGEGTGRVVVREHQYPRVYHRASLDRVADLTEANSFQYGWNTNRQTKWSMMTKLQRGLADREIDLFSERSLHEIAIYENAKGRLGAPGQENDDCVVSAALGFYRHAELPFDPGAALRPEGERSRPELEAETRAIWAEIARLRREAGSLSARRGLIP